MWVVILVQEILVGGGYVRTEDRWGCVLGAFEENARQGTCDLERLASEIEGQPMLFT
jgi:hypothetical protein